MNRNLNNTTQPFKQQAVFNNWDVVAKGWYAVCASADVPAGGVFPVDIARQHIVVFRGEDGTARAVDGFCPHMGTDLAIGRVDGNCIRCFFHHWAFDGEGRCVDVPAGGPPPQRGHTRGWATDEKYGLVWVWPEPVAPVGVPEFANLVGKEVVWRVGRSWELPCHGHVAMINGIDVQHLKTVHQIDMHMDLAIDETEDAHLIDFTLEGELPSDSMLARGLRRLLGGSYSYRMRYAHASAGLLTTVRGVRLLGRWLLPEFRMIFAYLPLDGQRTRVTPVFVTERRTGLLGRVLAEAMLLGMYLGMLVLKDEDGKIYENIRFQTTALLPMDGPIARFQGHVNRLEPSAWSPLSEPGR